MTNFTNSPEVFGPGVGLSSKTFGEFVKFAILVQFHTFEAMGLEMLVLQYVCKLLHIITPKTKGKPIFSIQGLKAQGQIHDKTIEKTNISHPIALKV